MDARYPRATPGCTLVSEAAHAPAPDQQTPMCDAHLPAAATLIPGTGQRDSSESSQPWHSRRRPTCMLSDGGRHDDSICGRVALVPGSHWTFFPLGCGKLPPHVNDDNGSMAQW
ncbi:hypothetical protein B0I35DRAFT_66018 [Stachybotrys elegans]|uniref:Uncharacterized protein n=1 Tax=Stachybotrys elegans TaxID=80388 RepID=A0A8K0SGH5_9HYPO|nr:hypothetical protein B0I35DRAFT_66018 [Stachybotrys elegans]